MCHNGLLLEAYWCDRGHGEQREGGAWAACTDIVVVHTFWSEEEHKCGVFNFDKVDSNESNHI